MPSFLRRAFATLETWRTASIAERMSSAAGTPSASGQSCRCTLRPPVRPCQTRSETSGMSGAATRVSVSSTVYSVSNASRLVGSASSTPTQNRSRERRMYQLVSASAKSRSLAAAIVESRPSRSAATSRTRSPVSARMYRSSTFVESVRQDASYPSPSRAADAALAYVAKKYHAFHSGSMNSRTPARMPSSVTTRLPPRSTELDMRNQRMASEPSRSNTSLTSG